MRPHLGAAARVRGALRAAARRRLRGRLADKVAWAWGRATGRSLRVLPVTWLDRWEPSLELEQAREGFSVGPDLGAGAQIVAIPIHAVRAYRFRSATVHARTSAVRLADRVVLERVEHVPVELCDYTGPAVRLHSAEHAAVSDAPVDRVERGLFLGGLGAFNYYHWMIELLPKLQHLATLDERWGPAPLLVPDDALRVPTFREALSALVPARQMIALDSARHYLVEDLLAITAACKCPFNLVPGQHLEIGHFVTRPESLLWLRRALLDGWPRGETPATGRRLFFARKAGRRPYNEDEVFEALRPLGFERVHMADHTLREQARLLADATHLVGPTGAEWTNLLFASPGLRCVTWMAEEIRSFSSYSNLASVVGARLRFLTYATGAKSTGELYARGYRMDPRLVADTVAATLGDP